MGPRALIIHLAVSTVPRTLSPELVDVDVGEDADDVDNDEEEAELPGLIAAAATEAIAAVGAVDAISASGGTEEGTFNS